MTITQIEQQARRKDRYSVYVDGVYSFSLKETELLSLGLHSGKTLSDDELKKLQDISKEGKWYDRILNLLSIRMRSEWEVRTYLKRKDCPPEQIDALVAKLYDKQYLDDHSFAAAWVQSRRSMKATSRKKLALELRQKRIDATIIDAVLLQDKDEVDERQVLLQLAQKKQPRYPDKLKLMQYLARQGYNYDDIKAVMTEIT